MTAIRFILLAAAIAASATARAGPSIFADPDPQKMDFSAATAHDPISAVVGKALVHYLQHQYELSAREFSIAIARYPKRADFYERRCLVYLGWDGHDDLALADCDKAIALRGAPDADLIVDRGDALVGLGRYEEAVAEYSHALEIDPKTFRGTLYRCRARAMWGQELDKAWNDCASYSNTSGGDVLSHEAMALIRLRAGRPAEAIGEADKALAIYAKRAPSFYVRGLAKRKAGDTAGGDADVAAAEALDPNIAGIYAKYGVTP